MAKNYQDWEELGRSIQDVVDRAVNSQDYQKLNQTIRQTVERAVDMGSEAVRRVVDDAGRKTAKTTVTAQKPKPLPVLYGNTSRQMVKGVLQVVGGSVLAAVTFAVTLATFALDLMFGVPGGGFGGWLAMACFAVGGVLIGSGTRVLCRLSRFKSYRKLLGDKTQCTLKKLAAGVGKPIKFVKKELGNMIDQGLFLEGHLDREETMLITSHETWQYFEQSRLQLEQRQLHDAQIKAQKEAVAAQQDPRVREVLEKGNAFIAQIRRCNDAIPGEEISRKIFRMEDTVCRIFRRAEANPDVIPDLKKLMDYYLPMTVKLLNAYAEMDELNVQGENIQASKREIEATLDTLNLAFEKLLDDLFEDTALDVSSDISVLQTLLAQEGLMDDELTKLKKTTEVTNYGN